MQQTQEPGVQNEETQKKLAFVEASTHERSRSPESVFTGYHWAERIGRGKGRSPWR